MSQDEIVQAIHRLLQRVQTIEQHAQGQFPLYAVGPNAPWVLSKGGSWTGGFWAACWWLRAMALGLESDRMKAEQISLSLASKLHENSANRSFLFWYGAVLGQLLFQHQQAQQLGLKAIHALAASYDEQLQCVPVGPDMGAGLLGYQTLSVDGFAPLIGLLNASEQALHAGLAQQHTQTVLSACWTPQGAFYPSAHFQPQGFHPQGRAGDWSRGQAWGMLGLAQASTMWGAPYVQYAHQAFEYWENTRPDAMVRNRLFGPEGHNLEDPSATILAALAMLSFPREEASSSHWWALARERIEGVIRSPYFAVQPDGSAVFWGACYQTHVDQTHMVESTWGLFLLLQALYGLLDIPIFSTNNAVKSS